MAPLLAARVATAAGTFGWTPFLVVHLLQQGYTPVAAASVLTVATVTPGVAAPLAGYLSDRLPVHRMMVVTTLVAAGGLFALALGARFHWVAYLAALLMGIASAVNSVSFRSAVPGLVAQRDLPQAYSLLHSGMNVGAVLGPGLVGLAAGREQYALALLTAGALFLLAAAVMLLTAGRWQTAAEGPDSGHGTPSAPPQRPGHRSRLRHPWDSWWPTWL
nr:MAG: hypothetical protein DIU70_10480 [Bacillota bacterium]